MSKLWKCVFGLLLAVATHQTLTPKPADVFEAPSDKLLHVLCWAVLSAALYLAFRRAGRYGVGLMILFGYSVILEIFQFWVPGRSCSGEDMLANGFGCVLIYVLVKFVEWRWPALKAGKA